MIGIKSLVAIVLVAAVVAITAVRGVLAPAYLASLSAGSCFAIGVFASVAAALVAFGWRPAIRSRTALVLRPRPAIVDDASAHELPALAQRLVLVAVFACIALCVFGNQATARIAGVPADLSRPSKSAYCQPEKPPEEVAAPAPIVQPVDQAGCALVKRAFALGYTKTLGSCAPKTIAAAVAPVAVKHEACTGRQLDEPFLHYTWRRVLESASGAAPGDAVTKYVDGFRTRLDYTRDLVADVGHAVTGSPHASHHVWVNLADPHPAPWNAIFVGTPPCATRYADMALWPRWTASTPPSAVFEHVFGQLLFATRFGDTASCSDYTIHWGAPADACKRLVADPTGFLGHEHALAPIRAVLDRRRRQIALRALDGALGRPPSMPVPPDARAVVSLSCFVVDAAAATVESHDVTVDPEGEPIAVRDLHVTAIHPAGAGPLDVYTQLVTLLGGVPYSSKVTAEALGDFADASFPLVRLEPLADADPFGGARAAVDLVLGRADIVEVYPFEPPLHAFVDAFRKVYLAQRGRL